MKETRRLLPLPLLLLLLLDLQLPLLLPLPLLLLLLLLLFLLLLLTEIYQKLLLLLTEEYQKHLPAPKQQGTEGRTGYRIAPKNCSNVTSGILLELKT